MKIYPTTIPPLDNLLDQVFVHLLISCLLAFSLYWFVAKSATIEKRFFKKNEKTGNGNFIIFTKYFGFIVMGFFPLLYLEFAISEGFIMQFPLGLEVDTNTIIDSLLWTIGLGVPAGIVAYLSTRNSQILIKYPEIRGAQWNSKLTVRYLTSWFFYLLGYEFMFRGVMFLAFGSLFGFWIALALNLAMYCATHIPKGLDEAVGALLIGALLCVATWLTGNIWCAFLVHIVLSWTTNYFAIKKAKASNN